MIQAEAGGKPAEILSCVALVLAMALCGAASAQGEASYKITKEVALGAPDRWDYVVFDPVLDRAYVAHNDTVTVVDAASGKITGHIDGITGTTHGIASVHAVGKGYTDDSKAGIAVSFDLKTLKIINRIKAEPDADGIVYDPFSGHVLVIDGDSGKVTVIDPKIDKAVATIDAGGGLEFGVSDEKGKFFVDGAEKGEIVRMDMTTNKADAHWSMPNCVKPHGLAIDRSNAILFASCANKVMTILNAKTGTILATLPIGDGTDFAEFDAKRSLAFSSNREGTLSVIEEKSPTSFAALPSVPTEMGARTMALDPKTGRIFLVAADFDVDKSVPVTDLKHRYTVRPGSVKLLFLDPVAK